MPPILYLDYVPSETSEASPKVFRFTSGMITFGREEGNDVVVLSSALSRQHARILPAGNHWAFCDLGSTNGSWLNSNKIEKDRLVLLRNQDELTLADAHFTARLVVESDNPGARYTRSLLVFNKEKFHSEFPMESPTAEFMVGGKDSHLKVGDTDQFAIQVKDDVLTFVVKEPSLPVKLNGEPVTSDQPLKDCDFIEVGEKGIIVNSSIKATDFYTGPPVVETVNPLLVDDFNDAQGLDEAGAEEVYQQLPPTMNASSSSPTWESKSKGSGSTQNRRFIFGAESADPSAGTVHMAPEANPFRDRSGVPSPKNKGPQQGFEMSLSGRMASVPAAPEESFAKEQQRRVILGVSFIAFALILGLAVIVMLVLN